MKNVATICFVVALSAFDCLGDGKSVDVFDQFILGADISWVPAQEEQGVRFSDNGVERDILAILKDHGFNWIRLRIFNDPKAPKGYSAKGHCDLEHTVIMAKRIKAAGMKFLLDFHYSDTWADPGHQYKPQAWADLEFDELVEALGEYTKTVVTELKKHRVSPEMVQIGNEISNGFLWPDGKYDDWDKFAKLVTAGVRAVRQVDPAAKVMIHLAWGGQNAKSRWFLDKAIEHGIEFDILGQSYYPKWHGTIDDLRENLGDLASRYKQPVICVEYSQYKRQVNDVVYGLPDGKGLGTFIWEPTKWGEPIFDKKGVTLPLIDTYARMAEDYRRK